MGWGDEIMVTARVRRMQVRDPRPVGIRGGDGLARWHSIWDNNPRMAKPGWHWPGQHRVQWLHDFPGHRPYLDYSKFRNRDRRQPYVYTQFRAEPGEIYLSPAEKNLGDLARGAVILEPNIKASASPNKDWGWQRWRRLARELQDLRLIQIGAPGVPQLGDRVEFIATRDIREACGVLSGAALLISPEGGLHHAAAALGIRAVVIFGGFISPATTGYELHTNLFTGGVACGMRVACAHCQAAMERITPAAVAMAAREQLRIREACAA